MPRPAVYALAGGLIATTATGQRQPVALASQTFTVAQQQIAIARIVSWIWIAGMVIGIAFLCAGFARLTWIASRCAPVIDRRWLTPAQEIAAQLGLRREITVLQSAHDSLLVTWGLWSPKIILPAGARDWTDDRVRIVLRHE